MKCWLVLALAAVGLSLSVMTGAAVCGTQSQQKVDPDTSLKQQVVTAHRQVDRQEQATTRLRKQMDTLQKGNRNTRQRIDQQGDMAKRLREQLEKMNSGKNGAAGSI